MNYFTTVPYTLPNGTVFFAPPFFTPKNTDFLEIAGKVSWAINDAWTVGGGVFYAWDWLGTGAPGTYVNGTAKWTIPENTFAGLLGIRDLGRARSLQPRPGQSLARRRRPQGLSLLERRHRLHLE